MKRYVRPNSSLQLREQVQDLGLDRDVERRDGLVGDDELRRRDERPGDPDPLALAARELVWVAVVVLRVQADDLEHLAHPRLALGARPDVLQAERLADDRSDRPARVERRVRILEDELDLAAQGAQRAGLPVGDVLAVVSDRAARRLEQARDEACDGGLPAAGLSDEAERATAGNVERHPVHRVHLSSPAAEEHAAGEREELLEALDGDQRSRLFRRAAVARDRRALGERPVHARASCERTSLPIARRVGTGRWHATV